MYVYHLQNLPTNCHENTGYPDTRIQLVHPTFTRDTWQCQWEHVDISPGIRTLWLRFSAASESSLKNEISHWDGLRRILIYTVSLVCNIAQTTFRMAVGARTAFSSQVKPGMVAQRHPEGTTKLIFCCFNWDVWINLNDDDIILHKSTHI